MGAVEIPEVEVVLLTDATVVFDLDLTGDKPIGISQGEPHMLQRHHTQTTI